MEYCPDQNSAASTEMLNALPESQGGIVRHKCCNCAYQDGLKDSSSGWAPIADEIITCAHGSIARRAAMEALHENQGGSQRHKCAICAYKVGYAQDIQLDEIEADEGYCAEEEIDKEARNKLVIVDKPETKEKKTDTERKRKFAPKKISFEKQAKAITEIGLSGELLVLNTEINKLKEAKQNRLAKSVMHVSKALGDGAGYDVLSFDTEGNELHIEVKTTIGGKEAPFYLSENELAFAEHHKDSYRLYRLYHFNKDKQTAEMYFMLADELLRMKMVPQIYRCIW